MLAIFEVGGGRLATISFLFAAKCRVFRLAAFTAFIYLFMDSNLIDFHLSPPPTPADVAGSNNNKKKETKHETYRASVEEKDGKGVERGGRTRVPKRRPKRNGNENRIHNSHQIGASAIRWPLKASSSSSISFPSSSSSSIPFSYSSSSYSSTVNPRFDCLPGTK